MLTHQVKLNPPTVIKADFITAGDFIVKDDLFHPIGWI
jgi:hypothetical protein